jgi:predicted nucleotidyltransferase
MDLEGLLAKVASWAAPRPDLLGVALVGSYASGKAHEGSDVDFVVVVENVGAYLSDDRWLGSFGDVESVENEDYGLVQSRRVRYGGGLEVEWGLADRRWLSTEPLDTGTAKVVAAGMRIVYDPHGRIANLARACEPRPKKSAR